ncbi:DUF6268 family outer membrane beta-barrel protein [Nibricoccus sp. IMCC34717]|uniref:DUF6268 family outer membrane beta-barrel protein n=1 Tax=Nibricoccus sp. IMCC34717 TaxID=3034021 RepID=UPI00384CCA2D
MRFLPLASLASLALLTAATASAQRPPATELSVTTAYSTSSDARVRGQAIGEIAVTDARASAKLGSTPFSSGALGYGITVQYLGIDADDSAPLPDSIGGAVLDLTYAQPVLGDKRLFASLRPGYYGTGLNASGTVFLSGQTSPDFTWLAGVVLDVHSKYTVLPVLGFVWKPSADWTVALRVPRTEVSYRLTPSLEASLGLSVGTGTYRTGSVRQGPAGTPDLSDSWFNYRELRVGPALSWQVNNTFRTSFETGLVIDRRFEFDDRNVIVRSDDAAYVGLSGLWQW